MNNIKELLGLRIKELRKQKGITQEKLAEMINIDQRNLSNIECGVTFPSKSLGEITKALNISLTDLFDFEHVILTSNEMKYFIQKSLDDLSDYDIKVIYRLIKSMI